mmetsp:Transcript_5141/g.11575  ORF Transcript_5141/g.11575 Transcript_5141/m.11575 type:complete len:276 (-) Transcript_5141:106-933(-)
MNWSSKIMSSVISSAFIGALPATVAGFGFSSSTGTEPPACRIEYAATILFICNWSSDQRKILRTAISGVKIELSAICSLDGDGKPNWFAVFVQASCRYLNLFPSSIGTAGVGVVGSPAEPFLSSNPRAKEFPEVAELVPPSIEGSSGFATTPASVAHESNSSLKIRRYASTILRTRTKSSIEEKKISFRASSGFKTAARCKSSRRGSFKPNSAATRFHVFCCSPVMSTSTPSSRKIAPNSLKGLLILERYWEAPVAYAESLYAIKLFNSEGSSSM